MLRKGVTWFLSGNRSQASSRLQGYLIHDKLKQMNFFSDLFLAPPFKIHDVPWQEERLQIIANSVCTSIAVFQKLNGPKVDKLITLLRQRGIKTIYIECDLRPNIQSPFLCDQIVVPSQFLVSHFSQNNVGCTFIPDPIEHLVSYEDIRHHHEQKWERNRLRLAWVGHKDNWDTCCELRAVLQEHQSDYQLITISNHPDADFVWSLDTVVDDILRNDIAVIPSMADSRYEAKSSNRALLFMAVGLPVIAADILAYRTLITHGEDGFICDSLEEWLEALKKLRDPKVRLKTAYKAYNNIVPQFALERIIEQWLSVFELDITSFEGNTSNNTKSKYSYHRQKALVYMETYIYLCKREARRRCWQNTLYYWALATFNLCLNWQGLRFYLRSLFGLLVKQS